MWTLVARHTFEKEIISFCFSEKGDRLYAICKDKCIYEYNTQPKVMSIFDGCQLPEIRSQKIEHDHCNMTAILPYPVITGKDRNVIVTNDDYKMRLVMTHIPTHNEIIIKKTTLGPSYGGHIQKLRLVNDKVLAYSTGNKVNPINPDFWPYVPRRWNRR
jgi:hypothetical protein